MFHSIFEPTWCLLFGQLDSESQKHVTFYMRFYRFDGPDRLFGGPARGAPGGGQNATQEPAQRELRGPQKYDAETPQHEARVFYLRFYRLDGPSGSGGNAKTHRLRRRVHGFEARVRRLR